MDRDQWLAERRKGIGASDAPSVCGIRTQPTRLALWLDKRGEGQPDEPTEAMKWGLRMEPLIAEAYGERTGRAIIRTQIHSTHPELPWMRATIDGYDDNGDIVEFKAVGRWGAKGLGDDGDVESLPEAWVVQVQHQMACEESRRCHLAVFIDMSLRLYTVERNEAMLADIITMEREFWELVQSGTPPAEFAPEDVQVIQRHFNRDDAGHLVLADTKVQEAARDFHHASALAKQLGRDADEHKARLLFAMGNASSAECGRYQLKRKLINVRERTQTIKASSYIRFSCQNGESEE